MTHLYPQLLDDATRAEFERELALLCYGPVRVTAMQDGGKTWAHGNGKYGTVNRTSGRENVTSGNGRRRVAVDALPDAALSEGAACSLDGC